MEVRGGGAGGGGIHLARVNARFCSPMKRNNEPDWFVPLSMIFSFVSRSAEAASRKQADLHFHLHT